MSIIQHVQAEFKNFPVTVGMLIFVVSVLAGQAEFRYANSGEINSVQHEIVSLKVLVLEDRINSIDIQINDLERLEEQDEATNRDNRRLAELRNRREYVMRELEAAQRKLMNIR